jgi:hypothetical protein
MEWVPRSIASPAQYKCCKLKRTPRLPVVEGNIAPTESHELVRCAERRNLVSALVPSNPNCIVHGTYVSTEPAASVGRRECCLFQHEYRGSVFL